MLEVTDENGNDLASEFQLGIDYGEDGIDCADSCPEDEKGVCRCENLELFDVGN